MKRLPLSARRGDSKGVALIIVLSMLVLLSGLLVAFLTTARTERTAAAADSATAAARQISDSTVSFVISQIRDATTSPAENTTWASQPGAIRTFSGTLNGSRKQLKNGAYYDGYSPGGNDEVFKLYSSDRMRVSSGQYANQELAEETSIIESWDRTNPTLDYVDLNEPALSIRRDLSPDGDVVEPRYPIVDPRAAFSKTNKKTSNGTGAVQGFDAKIADDETFKLESGEMVPYVPMPVKWLYVLRDGTIGPASLGTEENPIVGRTAFWTDDDSTKLNINTASEGTFWDTPTASSFQECGPYEKTANQMNAQAWSLNLAGSQAVQGEYQRYPGHPATTSLSPALGWVWDVPFNNTPFPYGTGPGTAGNVNTALNTFKEAIYQLSPFMAYDRGTSQGATRNTDITASFGGDMKVKTKHLYTSVDEMAFRSARFKGPAGTGGDPELVDKLEPGHIERTRFFLTAHSRAPEINLFGRPRVTIWPINADYQYRTAADDLFIFTSKITKNPAGKEKMYCLLRKDAKGATTDYDGETSPSSAGFEARLKEQNKDMFRYLQEFTSRNVPGFGKSFTDNQKFGGDAGRDEVLTLIFDYIRTINLIDTGTTTRTANVFAPYTPKFFRLPPPANQYARYDRSYDWSAQVTPLRPTGIANLNDYQGLGRFPMPIEMAIVFHGLPPQGTERRMQATMAVELATVMPGYPAIRETYWTKITPLRPALIRVGNAANDTDIKLCGDATLAQPEGLINIPNMSSHEIGQGRSYMPTLGFITGFFYFKEHRRPGSLLQAPHLPDPNRDPNLTPYKKRFDNARPESRSYVRGTIPGSGTGNGTVATYPYVSNIIAAGPTTGTTNFTISDLGMYRLELFAGESPEDPRSALVYTTEVNFPPGQIGPFAVPTTNDMYTRLGSGSDVEQPQNVIDAGDVVRSMQLVCGAPGEVYDSNSMVTNNRAGDLRLAAARRVIPTNWWTPTDNYMNTGSGYKSAARVIHRLQRGHGDPQTGFGNSGSNTGNNGQLVANQGMRTSKPPILPQGVKGVRRTDNGPGDWDRHLSKHMSGPGGNKVDEGNLKFDPGQTNYTGMPYFRGRGIEETGQTYFSPNRQISSAVMFGSLPTGVVTNRPWQTLLFRPNRESGTTHPGANTQLGPPDHLLLDLFTLPVIEPYAISEPFSTAGKVNLNYVIAPFGYARGDGGNIPGTSNPRPYLHRDTAIRGLLKSTMIMAVPTGQSDGGHTENPQGQGTRFRYSIDLDKTIEAMETRLKSNSDQYPLFRSASEICTVDLYPKDLPLGNWTAFWDNQYGLTGDNMRERPYAHIYPRVTTKSNVYTVHMRCQAIRKAKGTPANEFDPDKDSVLGEYRGSATIERFVDPNDKALNNYNEFQQKVDPYYRYRVINTKQFSSR